MRLAFCIFSYFPYGGLERNFKSVADECAARGHEVDVYTMQWDGSLPESLNLKILPVRGWSNHRRAEDYVRKLQAGLQEKPAHLVIGFNKMPGLDLYYA
ncbi:MAG: glycosyltransferase, partial [Desulfobia sp.]